MSKTTQYVAKVPDAHGSILYTDDEHEVWHTLYTRQLPHVQNRACKEYLDGVDILGLSADHIPQCNEVSAILEQRTGWGVEPVAALISFDEFYTLLSNRRFPAASFIRCKEELDYLEEPDIFHEIFGHCPLLTDQAFADFTEAFGKIGLATPKKDRALLARLYWFTVEFGLIQTADGIRIYGGGIMSSFGETQYALESEVPQRNAFSPMDALRTSYRYDIMQTLYYVINSFDDFYELVQQDIPTLLAKARKLGDFKPTFPPKEDKGVWTC
tara:strand:+ start:9907 stop:10716 length:810 start_codon:yes stop_codon:yes gene_type:complete